MMVVRVGSRPRVGIQGVRASFHDVAARSHFRGEEIELVEYPSFGLLGSGLASGEADLCLMAIENSIAGSILPNYSLLEKFGFKIQGEVYLRIEMCLLALPGDSIESIRYVKSHPMAIFQCEEFLSRHSWMSVLEGPDTADSAREIAENRAHGYAAIASSLAAEVYDLNLLQQGIETDKRNYTRFLVICRSEDFVQDPLANKASVRFETSHQPGSLADVLDVLRAIG